MYTQRLKVSISSKYMQYIYTTKIYKGEIAIRYKQIIVEYSFTQPIN